MGRAIRFDELPQVFNILNYLYAKYENDAAEHIGEQMDEVKKRLTQLEQRVAELEDE